MQKKLPFAIACLTRARIFFANCFFLRGFSTEAYSPTIGAYSSFASLTSALEAQGIHATKAGLQRVPTQPIELNEAQMVDVENLLDKIEDDDDVQAVYTNLG